MVHVTGYSAPSSAGHSLNNSSNTDTSGIEVVEPPAKRVDQHVPAAPAITAQVMTESPTGIQMVNSSSSSDLRSVAASSERRCRLEVARAKQETARRHVDLANKNQQVAEGELEEALATSVAGSVGRLADLESNSGHSARGRPRSDAGAAAQPLQIQILRPGESARKHKLRRLRRFAHLRRHGGGPPPARAAAEEQPRVNIMYQQNVVQHDVVHEALLLQHNVLNEGCSWQDPREAVEYIKEVAERRPQEVLQGIACHADENHRRQVAQLTEDLMNKHRITHKPQTN